MPWFLLDEIGNIFRTDLASNPPEPGDEPRGFPHPMPWSPAAVLAALAPVVCGVATLSLGATRSLGERPA